MLPPLALFFLPLLASAQQTNIICSSTDGSPTIADAQAVIDDLRSDAHKGECFCSPNHHETQCQTINLKHGTAQADICGSHYYCSVGLPSGLPPASACPMLGFGFAGLLQMVMDQCKNEELGTVGGEVNDGPADAPDGFGRVQITHT